MYGHLIREIGKHCLYYNIYFDRVFFVIYLFIFGAGDGAYIYNKETELN